MNDEQTTAKMYFQLREEYRELKEKYDDLKFKTDNNIRPDEKVFPNISMIIIEKNNLIGDLKNKNEELIKKMEEIESGFNILNKENIQLRDKVSYLKRATQRLIFIKQKWFKNAALILKNMILGEFDPIIGGLAADRNYELPEDPYGPLMNRAWDELSPEKQKSYITKIFI